MPRDPLLRVAERPSPERKSVDAPFDRARDEAGLFEHPQVPGNRGLGGAEAPAEVSGAARLATRKHVDDRAPGPVRQGVEGPIERRVLHSRVTICLDRALLQAAGTPVTELQILRRSADGL